MTISTYGTIGTRTAAYAAKKMLEHARPIIVLDKFAQSKPLPKNSTDTQKFRRPVPWTVSTTPLAEGVTPAAQAISYVDVTVQLQQYGNLKRITDKVADLSEDPVLNIESELAGENAAETMEMVTYGVVKAGTSVVYTNGSSRGAVNTVITLSDLRNAARSLMSNRGKRMTKVLGGSADYNTTPIEAAYIVFAHTDCDNDIRNLPGFVPVAEYGSRQPVSEYECGSVENFRFILSPLLEPWADAGGAVGTTGTKSTTGSNSDVYPYIIIARDAYGVVPLAGKNAITPIVISPGTPSKSDPLGQRGYVGWKAYHAAVRLNENWLTRLESAVTDL